MTRPERAQAYRVPQGPDADAQADSDLTHMLELREEQLVAHKHLRELGDVELRTEVEERPGRLEVDAYREEVVIEHEPVGEVVRERREPWEEEDGVLVIPIYEEQLVVTKRLLLRERMRVRRVATTERQLFEDTLRRERLIVEDPANTGLVREQYPTAEDSEPGEANDMRAEDGLLGHLVRKALD